MMQAALKGLEEYLVTGQPNKFGTGLCEEDVPEWGGGEKINSNGGILKKKKGCLRVPDGHVGRWRTMKKDVDEEFLALMRDGTLLGLETPSWNLISVGLWGGIKFFKSWGEEGT